MFSFLLEIFKKIVYEIDLRLFQNDPLASFSSSGYLKINIEKCENIFTKNKDFLSYLNDKNVETVQYVEDSVIVFTSKFFSVIMWITLLLSLFRC